MKKLKLKFQNIEGAEILSREQLKSLLGGDGSDTGFCSTDADCAGGKTIYAMALHR